MWVALSRALADDAYLDLEVFLAIRSPSPAELKQARRSGMAIGASYPARQQGGLPPPRTKQVDETTTYLKMASNLHIYLVRAMPFKPTFPDGVDLAYELLLVEPPAKPSAGKPALERYPFCEHLHAPEPGKKTKDRRAPVFQRGYSDDPDGDNLPPDLSALLRFEASWRPEVLVRRDLLPVGGVKYIFSLPTFVLQSSTDELRVWAGSCLKPHGLGKSANALMYNSRWLPGDRVSLLPTAMVRPGRRPHALFQMGDQIYADDVSFTLFEGVKQLAAELLGGVEEKLPRPDGRTLSSLTPAARHALVGKDNGVTPLSLDDEVHNQLLGLGEFCAYYLMLLNPALWPDFRLARLRAEKSIAGLKGMADRLADEDKALTKSRAALRDYAAVMANVPTYAICDDHEVTDDWFFNKQWIERVKPSSPIPSGKTRQSEVSPIAQYLVANAMYAYAAFQGLGNDPDTVAARLKSAGGPSDDSNFAGVLSQLLKDDWSFTTPTQPIACFLDTRTQRSGDGNAEYGLSSTVLEYSNDPLSFPRPRGMQAMMMVGLPSLRALLDRRGAEAETILLVTPSPLLSSDAIEWQKRLISGDPLFLDEELWRSNFSNYFMMVDELRRAGITRCVNLAGDVHYGYRRLARLVDPSPKESLFRRMLKTPPEKSAFLTIEQLVCSPLQNKFEEDWLSDIQALGFASDYATAKRYLRREGGLPSASNAWIVAPDTGLPLLGLGAAKPAYVEHLEPLACPCADGKSESSIITDNHFVELRLGRRVEVTPVFHVARSTS